MTSFGQRTLNSCYTTGLIFFLVWLFLPAAAPGHSLFIQSSRYQVDEGKASPLFFCYGHHIPVDDGLRAEKLNSIRVRTPNGNLREMAIRNETSLHAYMVTYDAPGTYALFAESNPGYYTVYIDKKGRERQTIKAKNAIADNAERVLKSLYSKQYTKTYVVCGTPSPDFPARLGQTLELVPVKDISTLKAGDVLELKVYFNGKPYTGQGTWDATYNGFSTESEDNFHNKTIIKGDTVRVRVPNGGRWFVRYFIKSDAQGDDAKQYTQMKHTATLVFQIPNARKSPPLESH